MVAVGRRRKCSNFYFSKQQNNRPKTTTAFFNILFLLFFLRCSNADASSLFDASKCDQSKRCVFGGCASKNAAAQNCHYLFSVRPDPNNPDGAVEIELHTKRDSAEIKYIAAGFSADTEMGDDSVTYCVVNPVNNKVEAHLGMNPANDKSNMAATKAVETGTLELIEGSATEEEIYCKVLQHSNPSKKRDIFKPDLQKRYHLFLVKGGAERADALQIHSLDSSKPEEFPFVSARKILVLNPADAALFAGMERGVGNETTTKNESSANNQSVEPQNDAVEIQNRLDLVDLHGILMLSSWLAMTTIAIYSARYMRNAWPHTTVMGLKIWFHIHRTLNFLAVIVMVASAVLIVWSKQRWTGPWFGMQMITAGAWHSLAGASAVLFALTQPFGALIRCGIDDPKRPLFNWVHRGIGLFGFLSAQVAIYLAVSSFKRHFALPDFAYWLLVVFYSALLILILASEVLRFMEVREQEKITAIEMQTRARGSTPSDAYYYHTRKHYSSKLASLRRTLFTVGASICVVTAFLLVILIFFH